MKLSLINIKNRKIKTDIGFIYVGLKVKYIQDDSHPFGIITEIKDDLFEAKWYKTNSFTGNHKKQFLFFYDIKNIVIL